MNFEILFVMIKELALKHDMIDQFQCCTNQKDINQPPNSSIHRYTATVKKLFNLPGSFLTKRDEWAGTFETVLTRKTPRTDCPGTRITTVFHNEMSVVTIGYVMLVYRYSL